MSAKSQNFEKIRDLVERARSDLVSICVINVIINICRTVPCHQFGFMSVVRFSPFSIRRTLVDDIALRYIYEGSVSRCLRDSAILDTMLGVHGDERSYLLVPSARTSCYSQHLTHVEGIRCPRFRNDLVTRLVSVNALTADRCRRLVAQLFNSVTRAIYVHTLFSNRI